MLTDPSISSRMGYHSPILPSCPGTHLGERTIIPVLFATLGSRPAQLESVQVEMLPQSHSHPRSRIFFRRNVPLAVAYSSNLDLGSTVKGSKRPKISIVFAALPYPLPESEVDKIQLLIRG